MGRKDEFALLRPWRPREQSSHQSTNKKQMICFWLSEIDWAAVPAEGSQSGVWWASFFVGYGRGHPPMLRKERENAHKHTPHQRFPSLMEEESWKRMESNQWSERKSLLFSLLPICLLAVMGAEKQRGKRDEKRAARPTQQAINSNQFFLHSTKKKNNFLFYFIQQSLIFIDWWMELKRYYNSTL